MTHSVEKTRNSLSLKKKIRQITYLVISLLFSKTDAFTKFLRKKCEREFLQFPHCDVEITEIYSHSLNKNFVKSPTYLVINFRSDPFYLVNLRSISLAF